MSEQSLGAVDKTGEAVAAERRTKAEDFGGFEGNHGNLPGDRKKEAAEMLTTGDE